MLCSDCFTSPQISADNNRSCCSALVSFQITPATLRVSDSRSLIHQQQVWQRAWLPITWLLKPPLSSPCHLLPVPPARSPQDSSPRAISLAIPSVPLFHFHVDAESPLDQSCRPLTCFFYLVRPCDSEPRQKLCTFN